jgi:hypothetical protein
LRRSTTATATSKRLFAPNLLPANGLQFSLGGTDQAPFDGQEGFVDS